MPVTLKFLPAGEISEDAGDSTKGRELEGAAGGGKGLGGSDSRGGAGCQQRGQHEQYSVLLHLD